MGTPGPHLEWGPGYRVRTFPWKWLTWSHKGNHCLVIIKWSRGKVVKIVLGDGFNEVGDLNLWQRVDKSTEGVGSFWHAMASYIPVLKTRISTLTTTITLVHNNYLLIALPPFLQLLAITLTLIMLGPTYTNSSTASENEVPSVVFKLCSTVLT